MSRRDLERSAWEKTPRAQRGHVKGLRAVSVRGEMIPLKTMGERELRGYLGSAHLGKARESMRGNPNDLYVPIFFEAVRDKKGRWLPVIWDDGGYSNWYSAVDSYAEAIRLARSHAEDAAERYTGDYETDVQRGFPLEFEKTDMGWFVSWGGPDRYRDHYRGLPSGPFKSKMDAEEVGIARLSWDERPVDAILSRISHTARNPASLYPQMPDARDLVKRRATEFASNPSGYADPYKIDWEDLLTDRYAASIEVWDTLNDRKVQDVRFDRRNFEVYLDKYKAPRYIIQVMDWKRPRDEEIVVDNQGIDGGIRIFERRNPATFTKKGERMYEDIKRGYGKDPRAKEIAARTVYARARQGAPGLVKKRRNPIEPSGWGVLQDDTILETMANALFVVAYADYADAADDEENFPRARGGEDWYEVAPLTPESAEEAARELAEAYGRANKAAGKDDPTLTDIFGVAYKAIYDARGGQNVPQDEYQELVEQFGRDLAMMAMGTGVSWFDDHPRFPLVVPDMQINWDGESDYLWWEISVR